MSADFEPTPAQRVEYAQADAELYTDDGAALRIAKSRSGELRRVAGQWLAWDGTRWTPDDGAAQEAARSDARGLVEATVAASDAEANRVRLASARLSAPRIGGALKLAASDPRLRTEPDDLDADPWKLNAPNGTIDLRTGELHAHDPCDLITRITGAEYHPDARSTRWERHLDHVTGGDRELRDYLQRAAGYTACGITSEEVLFFAHGPGATAKTTHLEATAAALGSYAVACDFATFLSARRDGDQATPGVAHLAGARLARTSEVEAGQRFAAARLKALTGGDRILARRLYRDPFEFTPRFTLWLAANERPTIAADDDGAWRRVRLLPFERIVPAGQRDPHLKRHVTTDPEDLAAVLAWIVQGALAWQQQGLGTCRAVEVATAGYQAEGDPLAQWIADRCTLGDEHRATTSALRADYEQWCSRAGERPITARAFNAALRYHGATERRTGKARGWAGITLAQAVTEVTVTNGNLASVRARTRTDANDSHTRHLDVEHA